MDPSSRNKITKGGKRRPDDRRKDGVLHEDVSLTDNGEPGEVDR